MLEHTEQRAIQDEDEIALVDIIRFFSRNGKFLILTTLGLSAIAIALSLLQPKQYQKQLALSVRPVPFTLSSPLNSNLSIDLDINQAGTIALTLLQNQPPDQITATSKFNTASRINTQSQLIDLTLKSANPNALKSAGPKILNQLKTGYQKTLEATVATNLVRIEQELNRSNRLLTEMEKQIAQTPKNASATGPNPRLLALEEQRSRYIETITSLEFDKQNLLQAQKNPAEFASRAILVQILAESPVRQSRSPMMLVLLVIIASFMVAVLSAIIRDQVLRLQAETSKQKIVSSKNV